LQIKICLFYRFSLIQRASHAEQRNIWWDQEKIIKGHHAPSPQDISGYHSNPGNELKKWERNGHKEDNTISTVQSGHMRILVELNVMGTGLRGEVQWPYLF
jgi:hypothetical protein